MLKKNVPLDRINGTKNVLCFLSRAPTHHSFTFDLRFLHELKHKIRLSKTMCEIFHFRFRFVFTKVYIFVQQNAWTFNSMDIEKSKNAWTIPFKIKTIEKPHTVLLPDL